MNLKKNENQISEDTGFYRHLFRIKKWFQLGNSGNLIILGVLFYIFFFDCISHKSELRVMTLNIRYDNPEDGINAWPKRQSLVIKTLKTEDPDVIGFQEVLRHQLDVLIDSLSQYVWFGVGRDDGKDEGEFAPIFFKKNRFSLLDKGTFWLSEYPDSIGSIGWNADLPRILTWVKLYDLQQNDTLFAFNTHYSHVSDEARTFSSKLAIKLINRLAASKSVIFTGDFNTKFGSEPYNILSSGFDDIPGLMDIGAVSGSYNDQMTTSNGFGRAQRKRIIDFIWTSKHFSVQKYQIIEAKEAEIFISDHYPVVGDLSYKTHE